MEDNWHIIALAYVHFLSVWVIIKQLVQANIKKSKLINLESSRNQWIPLTKGQ